MRILSCITERDIDLVVLEEFYCSPTFREWFSCLAFGPNCKVSEFIRARHSVSDAENGESDLVFMFQDERKRKCALLIENKITAPSQPEQPERYRFRGQQGMEQGEWDEYKTVIMAPTQYLHNRREVRLYDARISYEALSGWFSRLTSDPRRAEYKKLLIQEAIAPAKRRPISIPDKKTTDFIHAYWKCISREFPELNMREPGDKPAGSTWIFFKPDGLPTNSRIWHKMDRGHVDLVISGRAELISYLRTRYAALFAPEAKIIRTGKSAAIRIDVPKLDTQGDFTSQLDQVREGMRAAYRLMFQARAVELRTAE